MLNWAKFTDSKIKGCYSTRQKNYILDIASNKSISAAKIKSELKLEQSKRTVQRILQKSPYLIYAKFMKSPVLDKSTIIKRLNWALKTIQTRLDFRSITWSDEKKFNLDGPDGFKYYWHDLKVLR
jgi:hypothetical protein